MGEENYNKVLNVAASAVVQDGKILLLKRLKKPYVGFWSLPGGKIEFGEHVEEAALREIKEETGLDCKYLGLKGLATEMIHNKEDKVAHLMLYISKLRPIHTNFKVGSEGKLRWFDLNKLDDKKIIPSDIAMIKAYIINDTNVDIHKIKMEEEGDDYRMEEFRK